MRMIFPATGFCNTVQGMSYESIFWLILAVSLKNLQRDRSFSLSIWQKRNLITGDIIYKGAFDLLIQKCQQHNLLIRFYLLKLCIEHQRVVLIGLADIGTLQIGVTER